MASLVSALLANEENAMAGGKRNMETQQKAHKYLPDVSGACLAKPLSATLILGILLSRSEITASYTCS